MIIQGYSQFGGKHPVTGSLRSVLAHLGVQASHDRAPLSEEMLLGIGGGLGGLYFVFLSPLGPILVIGGRYLSGSTEPTFLERICQRIGVTCTVRESAAPEQAEQQLLETLSSGVPAIARLDLASMPYFAHPRELRRYFGHMAVVYGLDPQKRLAHLADRSVRPLTVTADELARSRRAIPAYNNRILLVNPPPEAPDLDAAVVEGIRDCCRFMLHPTSPGHGLGAWSKWAHLVAHRGSRKGWPVVFRPGIPLYNGLTSVFTFIETWGTGGGAFRRMYATFLQAASRLLGVGELDDLSASFGEIADAWSALARDALPESVAPLGETRRLLDRKARLFERDGCDALPELLEINARLEAIRTDMRSGFPLEDSQIDALLVRLRDHIVRIHDMERQALTRLDELFSA